jgi:hypothetical protein
MSKKNKTTEPEQAILLRRVSSSKQAKKGKFEATKEMAKKYAKGKGNNFDGIKYNLSSHNHDIIGSAFNKDIRQHPEMKDIFEKLQNGTYKRPLNIFVAVLDRIDRRELKKSLMDILNMLEEGIVLHELSTGLKFAGDTLDDDQISSIMTALKLSHMDSVRRSNRSKTAHRRIRKAIIKKDKKDKPQKYRTNSLPKWFSDHKKGKFIKDEKECLKLEFIFDRLERGYSAYEVMLELNDKGAEDETWHFKKRNLSRVDKEKGFMYRHWHQSDLKNLYDNDALYGCIQFKKHNPDVKIWEQKRKEAEQQNLDLEEFDLVHKKPTAFIKTEKVENYYPAIISKETFFKVRKLVSSRRATGGKPYCKSLVHRLCKCGYCSNTDGQLVNAKRAKKKLLRETFYYRMCSRSSESINKCTKSQFREAHIETLLLRYLKEIDIKKVLNPQAGTAVNQLTFDIKELDAKIAEQDDIISNAQKAIARRISQGKDTETYDDIIDDANDAKASLERELNELNTKLGEINSEEMLKFSKTKLAELEKQLESDTAKHQVNQELARIIDYIELCPTGLPKVNCLDTRGHEYGIKENRGLLYSYKFPAFTIVFRNGVRRTIVYQKRNLDNVLCLYQEGENYFIETFGIHKETPMVIGSQKFASEQTGVEFIDGSAEGVGEEGLMHIGGDMPDWAKVDGVEYEFKSEITQPLLDRYLATILKGWF